MITATYSDGKIQPAGPIPVDWRDGQHLVIDEDDQAGVEAEFARLAAEWTADTRFFSAVDQIIMHPAYHRIIGLGKRALPLILQELQKKPRWWFWALKSISGADPVPAEDRGDVGKMREHWLNWARNQGLLEEDAA